MRSHPPTSGLHHLSLQNLKQHMVWVEGGTMEMPEPATASGDVVGPIALHAYNICRYPVTQALWREVMAFPEKLQFSGADRPVEGVNWHDAVRFCNELSKICGLPLAYEIIELPRMALHAGGVGREQLRAIPHYASGGFRLPTWDEWLYAAMGGNGNLAQAYAGSEDGDEVGWFSGNSFGETQLVGQKLPNRLGLYEMSGNVWETVWNFEKYPDAFPNANSNSAGAQIGRFFAGSSWKQPTGWGSNVWDLGQLFPNDRNQSFGLRLAQSI